MLLNVTNLHKTYTLGRTKVPVLKGVDLHVREGEMVAVVGASGSGKSTLLHLLGGLDRPDRESESGKAKIEFDGRDLCRLSQSGLDAYRGRDVGFVFQFYHLIPELTVMENVLTPAMARWGALGYLARKGTLREEAAALLEKVGLKHRLRHRPQELSGGERQRVAIARALINKPRLLLADEPTGNLDRETGGLVLDTMLELARALRQTLVVVTHDTATAARADRTVRLAEGRVAA